MTGPASSSAVVIHIPHASLVVPSDVAADFLLTPEQLEQELLVMTDRYTDELFAVGSDIATTVAFPVSRFVVDPERFVEDADEPMARKGMGVIYERTPSGLALRRPPSAPERARLLARFYEPHHSRLTAAVQAALDAHGTCLVLDGHSFPARALPYEDQSLDRPDICIGTDEFHTPDRLRDFAVRTFEQLGYRVAVNRPFAGAIVPMRFYREDRRVRAVMVEVNRGLYMDERTGAKLPSFDKVRERIAGAVRGITGYKAKPRTQKLTARFGLAFAFANQLHRRQIRKGSGIPYLSHLLGVASLALEHGANEDEAIAAVLHDAVEDQGGIPTLNTIRRTFGKKVAEIVEECTDAVVIPKPEWKPRKVAYIERLATASKSGLLVSACDKLHNARSILGDYREVGEALWSRFTGGKVGALWYYNALIEAYRKVVPPRCRRRR